MKEKLKNLIQNVKLRQPRAMALASTLVVAIVAIGVFGIYQVSKGDSTNIVDDESGDNNLDNNGPVVAVVGEENSSNNSWPGEIISLNNLQVQPDREGTISAWYVRIGERVRAGQVIGQLSRPPQTPEMVSMLSERSQMLSEARTTVGALRIYTTQRIAQLKQLRSDTELSNKQKVDLLKSETSGNDDVSLSLIASKKKMAQAILRESITKMFPMISGQTNVQLLDSRYYYLQFADGFGSFDSGLRSRFTSILMDAWSGLKNVSTVPEKSGLLYFESAIKLANTSSADGEMLSVKNLESLKQMLAEDQLEFINVLGEIKSMELERVNTQRESIDTLAEIDAMIVELEKELAMSEGDVIAKGAAYTTMSRSITTGYSIVSPKGGIVSSIMKRPGEFVGPGMPVAIVTATGNDGVLVRMSIPSNTQKPKLGELLSIVRPGFGTDVQKARLVGVGSSLDDGSYMADAVFTEITKWPVGASVRVYPPESSSVVFVKHSSVFWSKDGIPMVWALSEADRIYAKKITIGRTLGSSIEVYEGLKKGDRYIVNPSPK